MNDVTLYHRGLAKLNLKAYGEAIRDFNESVQINPANSDIFYHRGFAHYYLGEYEAALDDFNQVFTCYSHQSSLIHTHLAVSIYFYRGLVNDKLQHYQDSSADFSEIIRLNPNEAKAYYHRGFIQLKLSQRQEALEDFHHASRLFKQQDNFRVYQEVQNLLESLSHDSSRV